MGVEERRGEERGSRCNYLVITVDVLIDRSMMGVRTALSAILW